ncbi:MAG: lysophospholipid acyltransferase family protein [Myxococcales bacterium]|nr:lysophospholipid acyltransferase family protein [Myxococcales bacterium]MCB9547643.1 lysophospholipid acyltransferase family protein [Myxococcales bacterium]
MQFVRDTTRRAVMILAYLLFGVLLVVSAPLWAPVTAVMDRVRGQSYLRCITFFAHFIWTGLFYLGQAQVAWVLKGGPFRDGGMPYVVRLWGIQRRWALRLLRGGVRLYRLDIQVEGAEESLADPGPLLLLSRHVSFGDTLLPFWIFAKRLPFQPRYVMKKELVWDPCIDIVGGQLPNAFVRRGTDNPAREIEEVLKLVDGTGPHDVVVVYPEGTRFTPHKRTQILERLEAKGASAEDVARARAYTHVLPPRPGGAVSLLEKKATDVVFLAHTGLEKVRTLRNLVDGSFVGTTLRIALWRISHQTLPAGREALTAWLHTRWSEVDAWVGRQVPAGKAAPSQPGA